VESWNKIETVERMQDYIREHEKDEPFNFAALYAAAGYTRRHADRLFRELLGQTPREYLRALRLSGSALRLLDKGKTVLEVALDAQFESHEGYSRAFSSAFGVSPRQYRTGRHPIPLYVPAPVRHYYNYVYGKEPSAMDTLPLLCTVVPVARPERRLMLLRSHKAADYWTFCEECCCDWEGLLNSLPDKFDTAAILTLPDFLTKDGYSRTAAGVELPLEYDGAVPDGYELVTLPPCEMLYFVGEPYENEEEFGRYIGGVLQAVETYDPTRFGYAHADELAPRFNFGADPEKGARAAIPARRLDS
jgi:AraC family transcriptional regulator